MAENLNYGVMVLDANGQTNDTSVEKFCYNNVATNCSTDGGLYTWAETMALQSSCNGTECISQISTGNHQGICPTGWHVPNSAEWDALATYLGGISVAGKKMKLRNTGFSSWDSISYNDGNSSGFSAYPAGYFDFNGGFYDHNFYEQGDYANYWVASESDATVAYARNLGINNGYLGAYVNYKHDGQSLRCLKD